MYTFDDLFGHTYYATLWGKIQKGRAMSKFTFTKRNVSLRYILPIVHKEHEKYLVRVWAKKLIYMTTTLVYYLYRPNSPASLTDPLLWLNGQLIHQFMDKAFLNVFAKFLAFLMIFHSSRKLTDLLRRQVNSAKVS